MFPRTLLLPFLLLGVASLSRGADETADRIAKLVVRLGSSSFTERESAMKELDAIGAPALPALKKTATTDDVETRRRAEELIVRIEKRLETARLLVPTKVNLNFRDTPLPEAIAELAKQSGQRIALEGDEAKFASRKVTLEMPDVPFWIALDRFCEAAGLIEPGSVSMPLRSGSWSRMGRAGPRQLPPLPPPGPSAISTQIVLTDGKPLTLPAHYAGAARIRAFAPNSPLPATRTPEGELLFPIGLGLEERVPLQKVLSLRIDRAIDEHGQELTQLGAGAAPSEASGAVFLGNNNGQPQAIISAAGQHPIQVKLKEGAKSAKALKELTGSIGVEVRTPPEQVLAVDAILKATGRIVKGDRGGSLTVLQIGRYEEGHLAIRVELERPPDLNNANPPLPGGFPLGARPNNLPTSAELQLNLLDAKGIKFALDNTVAWEAKVANNQVSYEGVLLFKPAPGQAEAARLVYTISRLTTMEIPFTLKDVPLP